jgi:hypothetical protein
MAEALPRSPIKLPPETVETMRGMEGTLQRAWHDIEVMKKLGMNTTALEEKLKWAEEARAILLREFS